MSRRKNKSERELLADLTDRVKLFCDSIYDPYFSGCDNCPLLNYETADCRLAYMEYILSKGGRNDE